MKKTLIAVSLTAVTFIAGCSSLPSLPSISMPWSGSSLPADPTTEALFDEGNRHFNNKSYTRAIDAYRRIQTDHPFSPLLTQTELKIADAYFLNKQYPEAINAFKEFQSLHPTNENIPFVTYRLGQSYFDQFTTTDRDQKNTEIAKGYFAAVITKYPQSPYVAEAKDKLARCIAYLAEHDFNVAHFYYQQEKFPAARDRFEEIVRKYQDTPTAVKSLFYLGESYRKEKNGVKAALAYEALLQYYPESTFASQARVQLAQLEKEKHDPMALLLMRDRRPAPLTPAPGTQTAQESKTEKLKELNLIAKTEVVHEEPVDEKGFFSRVVDTLNPFSSSDREKKKEEKKPESGVDLLVKQKQAEKEKSSGILASLWPFGGSDTKADNKKNADGGTQLVNQIDASLKQEGVDPSSRQTALQPPPSDLPKVDATPPAQTMDTAKLLNKVDSTLAKDGKNPAELPPTPEVATVFKDPSMAEAIVVKAEARQAPPEGPVTSGLLSSIDQKLKSEGVDTSQVKQPTPAAGSQASVPKPKKDEVKKVELEPKLAAGKGPLFLAPTDIPETIQSSVPQETSNDDKKKEASDKEQDTGERQIPKSVVKGPSLIQPATTSAKPTEENKPTSTLGEEDSVGALERLKQDLESASKVLNPFEW